MRNDSKPSRKTTMNACNMRCRLLNENDYHFHRLILPEEPAESKSENEFPAFHDAGDFPGIFDVDHGVGIENDEVREFTFFQSSDLVLPAQGGRGSPRHRNKNVARPHSCDSHEFHFAMEGGTMKGSDIPRVRCSNDSDTGGLQKHKVIVFDGTAWCGRRARYAAGNLARWNLLQFGPRGD